MRNILFADREFYKTLSRIAVPIALQQLVTSSVNLLDVLMVGADGGSLDRFRWDLSNQVFFPDDRDPVWRSSGMAIFSAQYWGRGMW